MLSVEENELITRCGPGTPMGNLIRQYWVPALRSDELPGPDCAPVRVLLMDEYLIGFRATSGKVGLVDDACPHRGASMFYGRNEQEGLRCVYHGWKFDTTGACTDMLSEPEDSNFVKKVRITAYPCVERGGIVWAYLGPRQTPPPLPDLESNMVIDGSPRVGTVMNDYNWFQAMENNIDTTHNPILHYGAVTPDSDPGDHGPDNVYMTRHRAPRFEIRDTEAGASYGCYRPAEEGQTYWRTMHWLFPFYTMTPRHPLGTTSGFVATVPMDDTHNMQWSMVRSIGSGDPTNRGGSGERLLNNSTDWYGRFRSASDPSTDFGLNRAVQQAMPPTGEGYTGIKGIGMQDEAMKWSQGRRYGGIVNRNREHLGTTDAGIIRVRRRLIEAMEALHEHGITPPGVDNPEAYRLRSGWTVLNNDIDWWEGTRHLREGFREEQAVRTTV
jgi:phthalate 4,5-dioxygenase oxygenase subunit